MRVFILLALLLMPLTVHADTKTYYWHNSTVSSSDMTAISKFHPSTTVTVASSTSRNKDYADYVCDGTNDNVEVQAAIDSITTGKVTFLEGNYTFGAAVNIKSGIVLEGVGANIVFIKPAAGSSINLFQYNSTNTVQGFSLRDMTLYGYSTNATVINTKIGAGSLQDAYFMNLYADGFGNNTVFNILDPWGIRFQNVIIEQTQNGTAINVTANGANTTGLLISNCKIKNNYGKGIQLNGLTGAVISNNEFYGLTNQSYCVDLMGTDTAIVSNNLFDAGTAQHLRINATSDGNIINNNKFNGAGTTPAGVVIDAGASLNDVSHNVFLVYVLAEIYDLGTSTRKIADESATLSETKVSTFPSAIGIGNTTTATAGIIRYDANKHFYGYNGTAWNQLDN